MEQLFKVNQPNISLSVPVNAFLPLYLPKDLVVVGNFPKS